MGSKHGFGQFFQFIDLENFDPKILESTKKIIDRKIKNRTIK